MSARAINISMDTGAAQKTDECKFATTRDRIVLCSASSDADLYHRDRAFCLGCINGVVDGHDAIIAGPELESIACHEPSVTRKKDRGVFVSWAEDEGEVLDNEAPTQGVMRAVVAKWPCLGK